MVYVKDSRNSIAIEIFYFTLHAGGHPVTSHRENILVAACPPECFRTCPKICIAIAIVWGMFRLTDRSLFLYYDKGM